MNPFSHPSNVSVHIGVNPRPDAISTGRTFASPLVFGTFSLRNGNQVGAMMAAKNDADCASIVASSKSTAPLEDLDAQLMALLCTLLYNHEDYRLATQAVRYDSFIDQLTKEAVTGALTFANLIKEQRTQAYVTILGAEYELKPHIDQVVAIKGSISQAISLLQGQSKDKVANAIGILRKAHGL